MKYVVYAVSECGQGYVINITEGEVNKLAQIKLPPLFGEWVYVIEFRD